MKQYSRQNSRKHPLARWTGFIIRGRWLVLASLFFATAAIFSFITGHLGIITDTAGMLSPELHYLKTYRDYKKAFPQSSDTIVIVIDGQTPDLAMDARDRLAATLSADTMRFKTVYAPGSETFFKKNGLLFLSESELEELSDRMADIQPLLGTLVREPDIRGLFSILEQAGLHGKTEELVSLYREIDRAVQAVLNNSFYRVSWVSLMNRGAGSVPGPGRRQFVIIQPALDYSTILPGKAAMAAINETAARLRLDTDHGVRIRLTGDIAMEYEELASVTRGAKLAGWLSLIMVAAVLFTGLKSPKMVLATLITLIVGLIWTAGFAAAAIGHLNMISVAFAVLFIGLGVDYSIHYCLRFSEIMATGESTETALERTAKDTGSSLVLCAITTSIGFFAFVPTDFSGVGELGLISGTGMFIGLFMNLTLLPVLLYLLKIKASSTAPRKPVSPDPSVLMKAVSLPVRHARAVRIAALILGLGSLTLVPRITYDWNPMNLRDQTCVSVTTFREMLKCNDHSPWSLQAVERPSENLEGKISLLNSLPVVDKVVDIESFVPDGQETKLSIIEEMDFTLGPVFFEEPLPPPSDSERIAAIQSFLNIRSHSSDQEPDTLKRLEETLSTFMREFRNISQSGEKAHDLLTALEKNLLGTLPPRLNDLELSLQADNFSLQDIPSEIKSRWVAADGRWRIEIFPAHNLNHRDAMIKFITGVRTVEPDATGYPVLIWEGGKVVSGAFKQAFALSLTAIAVLLFFLMPYRRDAVLIMVPLVLAGILTGAVMQLAGITLNFANIIALPLILGIGVDNGIHMVHRFRTMKTRAFEIFSTSTSRGVFFSTLTTICSFGNLAVSPHEGMASMGKLLAVGVGLTLICTMVLLPALLEMINRKTLHGA